MLENCIQAFHLHSTGISFSSEYGLNRRAFVRQGQRVSSRHDHFHRIIHQGSYLDRKSQAVNLRLEQDANIFVDGITDVDCRVIDWKRKSKAQGEERVSRILPGNLDGRLVIYL